MTPKPMKAKVGGDGEDGEDGEVGEVGEVKLFILILS
jgi:hypothetical protein